MNDDRMFDLADVEALDATFTLSEIAWATTPPTWRREHTSGAVEWEENFRWFFDFDSEAPSFAEGYVRRAVGNLARSAGEKASVQFARLAHIECRYAAFVAERAASPKVGLMFSALDASWLCRVERSHEPRDHNHRHWVLEVDNPYNPVCARLMLENPGATLDHTTVLRESEALIARYVDAEDAVLRHTADEAMAEAESEPVRRRTRL
ncbi:hypothetical protein [Burkholderia gladioli]|uniref:hypothetical protein n=1 Tax=Burkholderia gladioli TaxID=28095 RepID=UPI00163F841E|nr:hypothetical protein [Burkholderia gladioli]